MAQPFQFICNQVDFLAKLSTHEVIGLTNFSLITQKLQIFYLESISRTVRFFYPVFILSYELMLYRSWLKIKSKVPKTAKDTCSTSMSLTISDQSKFIEFSKLCLIFDDTTYLKMSLKVSKIPSVSSAWYEQVIFFLVVVSKDL